MTVYVIAEAGVNHNGSLINAKKLISVAKEVGANAIKFQTFNAENLVTRVASKAKYQIDSKINETQFEMLRKLELSQENFIELKNYASEKKIDFLSSPFDIDSFKFLLSIGVKTIKIASGEITNLPLLTEISRYAEKVILSTGMSNMKEIEDALDVIMSTKINKDSITVLHANSMYPSPYEDVNLRAMNSIQKHFGVNVGYSDHTMGIEVPIAAVAMGATIIEKHLTLDNSLAGPDHKASLEPEIFKQMIDSIRIVEKSLGSFEKFPSESEKDNLRIVRKSIVASKKIRKGEILSQSNITTKRPGNGRSPMDWYEVIGKAAPRDYEADENI